jgi:hypothetical protein
VFAGKHEAASKDQAQHLAFLTGKKDKDPCLTFPVIPLVRASAHWLE